MMSNPKDTVEALKLTMHGVAVGVLLHFKDNRNQLVFDPAYIETRAGARPTFTINQLDGSDYLKVVQSTSQRLPPVLANLLPEGALRQWLAQSLKVDINNEFAMLAYTGRDLPGALLATPLSGEDIPQWAFTERTANATPIDIKTPVKSPEDKQGGFSLAGVQIKFSSTRKDGRFNINNHQGDDSWIVKTPSTVHRHTPENEYSAMKLAQSIGVTIPEIGLVALNSLDNLPDIELPDEAYAYVIKRFDRAEKSRIHTEDFTQIFEVYAHDKYKGGNYEKMARYLREFSDTGLQDMQQMARRLLANILLANGDAHLKNWTIYYPDTRSPKLSPAYDIVNTLSYIKAEQQIALKMGKKNEWYSIDLATFEYWAKRIGVSWPAIRVHLVDAMSAARDTWPTLIKDLPMHDDHKLILKSHMKNLTKDFYI